MHELGVVFYVVKDVKKVAEENDVRHISAVTIELGEVSAVIPEYLVDCWNWARKKEPVMEDAELRIENGSSFLLRGLQTGVSDHPICQNLPVLWKRAYVPFAGQRI